MVEAALLGGREDTTPPPPHFQELPQRANYHDWILISALYYLYLAIKEALVTFKEGHLSDLLRGASLGALCHLAYR